MKINILLFWFGRNWGEGRTFQKVAEHLSEMPNVERVICVFPPNTPKENTWAFPLEITKSGRKLLLLSQNIRVIPGASWPFRIRAWVNTIARERTLQCYLRLRGFREDNTVLWVFPPHPYIDELIRGIPHRLLVAHIVDNFTKLEEDKWLYDRASVQYPRLQLDADIIFTGSDFNYRLFTENRDHCYMFENAVDEIFIGEASRLPHLSGDSPRLGYVGTISQRTDIDLLKYVARNRPEWSILIAGQQELSLLENGLLDLPNVSYLGMIPYRDLPKLLKSLDVCLIPHRNTDYCKSMSPLKLYQYMASGKPIVSTGIEGLEGLKEHLWVAETYEDFVKQIDLALTNDTVELSRRRIEAAKLETWDKRVSDMFEVVYEHFSAGRC